MRTASKISSNAPRAKQMTFHVGQRVVCVRGPIRGHGYGLETQPEIGIVYTIRRLEHDAMCLIEIVNCPMEYEEGRHEIMFLNERFRPIVRSKTARKISALVSCDRVSAQKQGE